MDLAIVGGGPAGLYLAGLLKNNYDVRVFEEHHRVGYPVHCTGLVTKEVLDFANKNVVLNKIRGAHIHLLNETITVEKKETVAYVIDRPMFDLSLYEDVQEIVETGKRVKSVMNKKNNFSLKVDVEYESKMVVGADGPRSIVRQMIYSSNVSYLNGVQYIVRNDDYAGEYVHIFLDRKYSDGFFSWIVPREGDVLVGLATYDGIPMKRINLLMKDLSLKGTISGVMGGQIPIGTLPVHEGKNAYLTGDAALFVKATSGGGLYYGLTGSKILAESILSGKSYEKNLTGMLRELKMDLYLHRIFSKMGDRVLLKIIRKLKDESILDVINTYGDIDRPYIVSGKLALNRKMLSLYPSLFYYFIRSIFP